MGEKEKNQGPIINSLQGELKPVDYSRIEKLKREAGVTPEYLKEREREYERWLKKTKKNNFSNYLRCILQHE